MSGLPPGWEWDYDGARWFYRYTPNGHIQFHFPKEGDEFPDFVDCFSPAPELAPEERLESQQQLKRRNVLDSEPKSKMRATGGPLSDFSMKTAGFGGPIRNDDDDPEDEGSFFYQPENFMYLGPGAYSDISPVADEDEREESLKNKEEKVDIGGKVETEKKMLDTTSDTTGVSPLQSQANTPSVVNSVPVRDVAEAPASVAQEPPAGPVLIINAEDFPQPNHVEPSFPDLPLLDSVEKPHQGPAPTVQLPPWNPIGILAEMPTEHTAAAHIELHPDPVEIADNTVLAPIETRIIDLGIAELPERTSPSGQKPPGPSTHELLHQTNMSDEALYGATFGTGSRPQSSSPHYSTQGSSAIGASAMSKNSKNSTAEPSLPAQQPQSSSPAQNGGNFSIKRKPSSREATRQSIFQPYIPGAAPKAAAQQQRRDPEITTRREHSNSVTREASLMMGPRSKLDPSDFPSILQPPQVPPKHPLDTKKPSIQRPVSLAGPEPSQVSDKGLSGVPLGASNASGVAERPLQQVPSVLRPARGNPQGRELAKQDIDSPSLSSQDCSQNTLKSSQFMAFRPGVSIKQDDQRVPGTQSYVLPQTGQVPQSLIPAPSLQQSMGHRPEIQRVATAPAQSLSEFEHQQLAMTPSPENRLATSLGVHDLPQFLRPPQGPSDLATRVHQTGHSKPPPTGTRARSTSDVPRTRVVMQDQSSLFPGQRRFALSSQTVNESGAFSSTVSSGAARPRSVIESVVRPLSCVRIDRDVQQQNPSPPSDRGLSRQSSEGSSEGSSFEPLTGSQPSGLPKRTPPSLEKGGINANALSTPSEEGTSSRSRSPNTDLNIHLRPAGTRPASICGPLPTASSTTASKSMAPRNAMFAVGQAPPIVPGKIPTQSLVASSQPQPPPSMVPGNRASQIPSVQVSARESRVPESLQSSSSSRRHSLPTGQLTKLAAQPIPGLSPLRPLKPPTQPDHVERPHSAQHISLQQSTPSKILPDSQYKLQPLYPRQEYQEAAKHPSSGRPQRPTVIPPSRQAFGPKSPSTPIRTPGHHLLPIQEHTEVGNTRNNVCVTVAESRSCQETRHNSPVNHRQFSTGSSNYPSSAESPIGQYDDQLANIATRRFVSSPTVTQQQSQSVSPVMPSAGQMYSPVQSNPFQRQSPTNFAVQSPHRTKDSESTLSSVRLRAKEKEKGSWLSKFMKGPGRPPVLDKSQPPHQVFSALEQSTQAVPPGPNTQFPNPTAFATKPTWNATSQKGQTVPIQQNPAMPIQAPSIMSGPSIVPQPRDMTTDPTQRVPNQSFGHQASQPQQHQKSIVPKLQEPRQPQIDHNEERMGQQPRPLPKHGLGLAPGSPNDHAIDNSSDAASVSTMDVSEAEAQLLSKPQLVTVEIHGPHSGHEQLPSKVAASQGQDRPQPATRQGYASKSSLDSQLTVAPLFSKTNVKTTVSAVSLNDRWAKKPAADYSGDDWGDDPWGYQ